MGCPERAMVGCRVNIETQNIVGYLRMRSQASLLRISLAVRQPVNSETTPRLTIEASVKHFKIKGILLLQGRKRARPGTALANLWR